VVLERGEDIARRAFTAFQLSKEIARRRPRRRIDGWLDFLERQEARQTVQTVLDGRVAHAEQPFHLFDGAVAPDESGDEDLVLTGELGQRWQREAALDSDPPVDEPHALYLQGCGSRHFCQFLPVYGVHS